MGDTFTTQEVSDAVEKKWRTKLKATKEKKAWYILDGKKITRVTIPKGKGTLKPGTLNSIKNQINLNREQFRDFVKCPLEAKDYEKIIRDKGLV